VNIHCVKQGARPGYPLQRWYQTVADAIQWVGVEALFEVFRDRLRLLANLGIAGVCQLSAGEMVALGVADPFTVMVKGELHSAKKLEEGRVRLIMVNSLIDQMVERFLFEPQNSAEIASHTTLPSKPGMGLHDEGLKHLREALAGIPNPRASDANAYDWRVLWWHLEMDLEVRKRLTGLAPGAPLLRAMEARFWALANAAFVFSDGVVWSQVEPGIMKSGSVLTAATNSRIRYMLARLVGANSGGKIVGCQLAMTMGDDCVESDPGSEAVSEYRAMGMVIEFSDRLDFCSTDLETLEPLTWPKMVANYLQAKPRDEVEAAELLGALRYNLRNLPGVDGLLVKAGVVGQPPN